MKVLEFTNKFFNKRLETLDDYMDDILEIINPDDPYINTYEIVTFKKIKNKIPNNLYKNNKELYDFLRKKYSNNYHQQKFYSLTKTNETNVITTYKFCL